MTATANENHQELIIAISRILLQKGMKATTMDSVAASLSMSKRTLYEIFGSKKEMIMRVLKYWQQERRRKIDTIFASSETVMEAMVRTFAAHQKMMEDVNVDFFLDMDDHFPEVRKQYDKHNMLWIDKLMYPINLGIEQGVFRSDINYPILLHLMRLQMESLKRMEEVFPPDISITDAFDTISISFLRSIATQNGLKVIDNFYKNNSEYLNSSIIENQS
ncbi:MAG: TetR/AcrR family transcriptional regulator [Muribaculaceae bacterium]|nr:TetR/AcrR family transcriptional regulator [Muribaculaceae bacterium]